jgi:hypothetical protein
MPRTSVVAVPEAKTMQCGMVVGRKRSGPDQKMIDHHGLLSGNRLA